MPITTVISSAKFIETVEKVIFEWLTDIDCFRDDLLKKADVHAGIMQDTDAATMKVPWCEYIVNVANTDPTGAGALNKEGRFKWITTEIGLRRKRPGKDLDLVILGDRLDNYFRDAKKGRSALGKAGIRLANLTGPIADDSKNYFLRRWFISGRILVTNA